MRALTEKYFLPSGHLFARLANPTLERSVCRRWI